MAMADRRSLLARLVEALEHPDVDGVLGTPDVVEELLLLGALEGKVVIGSMNRGGLDGATWTMDDRFTGYDADAIAACRLEGGKMLLRIDDQDPSTAGTIEGCARRGQRARRPRPHGDGRAAALPPRGRRLASPCARTRPSLARAITIASGLGTTSAHTWLKMPSCDDPEAVFARDDAAVRRPRRRARPDPAADLESWGRRPRPSRRSAVSWSVAPCSTRPTATCARPSMPPRTVLRSAPTRRGRAVTLHRPWGPGRRRRHGVELTPEDAGWTWTGLSGARARRRRARGPCGPAPPRRSCCRSPGRSRSRSTTRRGEPLGPSRCTGRRSVFTAVTRLRVRRPRQRGRAHQRRTGAEVALPTARCSTTRCPRRTAPPADVPVEVRGRRQRDAPGHQLRRPRRVGPRREARSAAS